MEFINKLEGVVAGWAKNVPHLPVAGQKWLAQNVWWIVLIGAILTGIAVIVGLFAIFGAIAILAAVTDGTYPSYAVGTITGAAIVGLVVALIFTALRGLIMAVAVQPLKNLQKKGWVLLFVLWLIHAISVVINAIFSFSVGGFIVAILFGAIGLAIGGYFLFEIRGQFAVASKPVAKTAKKA